MSGWDALSEEAREKLAAWPGKARALFTELVEDASSEMQRELLQRAVAAGHSPAEVHAFADELRGLEDEEAFAACTLDAYAPEGYTVVQLLRAEADPLYAYELKGRTLSPADEASRLDPSARPLRALASELGAGLKSGRARPSFDSEPHPTHRRPFGSQSKEAIGGRRRVDRNALGESQDAAPRARPSGPDAPAALVSNRLMEDLLNDAAHDLGIGFREQDVDDGTLTLDAALQAAATALGRGIPVPVALGPALGKHRRLALLLQLSVFGSKRAWQLYDPSSGELYWVSEGDLLARSELPFGIKTHSRITRVALPR